MMKIINDNDEDNIISRLGNPTPRAVFDDEDKESDGIENNIHCSTKENDDGGGDGVVRGDASPNDEKRIETFHAINNDDVAAADDDDDDDDIDNCDNASSPCSQFLKSDENNNSLAESYSENDDEDDDDMSLRFPPGHITRMEELNVLQNHNRHPNSILEKKKSVNPSIIPSYFFCPLTNTIMRDPVITPDGNTYERRAILRSLILEDCDPISRSPLTHDELTEDVLVRQAIHKARVEAWTRYAIAFQDENHNMMVEQGSATDEFVQTHYHHHHHQEVSQFYNQQEGKNSLSQDLSSNSSFVGQSSSSSSSLASSIDDSTSVNHGWSVPLGVHKVICSQPGLVVTTDIHRRSNGVKRKILLKSLVDQNKKADTKIIHLKRKKLKKNLKTVTTVITRDLIIPPGSYVDILETGVHGGRIRGRIVWEEELKTENDLALSMHLAELELRKNSVIRPVKPSTSPTKGKNIRTLFHRKSSSTGNYEHREDKVMSSISHEEGLSRSVSPITTTTTTTTIEYSGWISLQWENASTNYERDEAAKRREESSREYQSISSLATDEDKGPWTQPLPLGVYRVCGSSSMDDTYAGNHDVGKSAKQMPLYETSDCNNIIDFLVPNQCIEILETKILLRKNKKKDKIVVEGQVVLARCMVPTIEAVSNQHAAISSRTLKKFKQGWITINGESVDCLVSASPIAIGAYIVTADESGSCIEVVNTRLEFEDDAKMMSCGCGKEGMYHCVSVRALIASGGFVTLFSTSVGNNGVCVCGTLVQQTIYADPVPLGLYRITHPTTVTKDIGLRTVVIARLLENACVEVIDTKVANDGCVRGLVNVSGSGQCHDDHDGARTDDVIITGWVCLFEPPSFSWAEQI